MRRANFNLASKRLLISISFPLYQPLIILEVSTALLHRPWGYAKNTAQQNATTEWPRAPASNQAELWLSTAFGAWWGGVP
jgi:hypothetical protein